ncbi:hypothetical protein T08_14432 [Trichinella sp. T8]|nr:hypothetical protein T08_14432 [Trichinella sp. T8]
MKKHCPEVNWNIVDSLTCNITGYHLHMGHYSFDYDKVFWYIVTTYHINVAHQKHAKQIVCMSKFNWLRLSGKLEDYLSVSNQQVSVLYYGIGNCMRTTVSFSYVKEG